MIGWEFVFGFACGSLVFDLLWRFTFSKWKGLYNKQQEYLECLRKELFESHA